MPERWLTPTASASPTAKDTVVDVVGARPFTQASTTFPYAIATWLDFPNVLNLLAVMLMSGMEYSFEQSDSLILFDDFFKMDSSEKYRNQKMEIVLYLPVGMSIYLDNDMEDIIYDILQGMGNASQSKDQSSIQEANEIQVTLQQVLNEPMDVDEMICRSICSIES